MVGTTNEGVVNLCNELFRKELIEMDILFLTPKR
jgi:hypothetical protein